MGLARREASLPGQNRTLPGVEPHTALAWDALHPAVVQECPAEGTTRFPLMGLVGTTHGPVLHLGFYIGSEAAVHAIPPVIHLHQGGSTYWLHWWW